PPLASSGFAFELFLVAMPGPPSQPIERIPRGIFWQGTLVLVGRGEIDRGVLVRYSGSSETTR
ncbi:MAG: hypothetical protein WAN23_15260, partial [Candidatus Acidiferrales bacterium]